MGQYSIKEVEVLSGVKAHTIRIWEKRYEIVNPLRTDTNIRYYSDDQVRHILNLAMLNRNGYKISKLVKMDQKEITEILINLEKNNGPNEYYINGLITATIDLNENEFRSTINKALRVLSFELFCSDIIFPFLHRIGILWSTGGISPSQEHFASNLIYRRVIIEIEKLSNPYQSEGPKFMLFLPEGEHHEISLLISEYILRVNGIRTIYFGANLPLSDLEIAIKEYQPDYLLTVFLAARSNERLKNILDRINKLSNHSKLWIAGPPNIVNNISLTDNCLYLKSLKHLIEEINISQ